MSDNYPFDKKLTAIPIGCSKDLTRVRRTILRRGNAGTVLFQGPDADPNDPIAAKAIEEFSPDVVVAWREPGYQIGVKWQSESRRNTVRKWMVRGW